MTEKELKKLNRYQLLELLVMQTARADQLEQQLAEVQEKLNAREINLTVAGSIAEASVVIGGLMEAAQNTADVYMETMRKRADEIEAAASRKAEQILENARKEAQHILYEAYGALNGMTK